MIRSIEAKILASLTATGLMLGACALGGSSEKGTGYEGRPGASPSPSPVAYCPNPMTSVDVLEPYAKEACAVAFEIKQEIDGKKPTEFWFGWAVDTPSLIGSSKECIANPLYKQGYFAWAREDNGQARVTTIRGGSKSAATSPDLRKAVLTLDTKTGTYQTKVDKTTVHVGVLASIAECAPASASPAIGG